VIYRLRKWYFDFLTPGLDYCFVYFADVRILTAKFRSLTVHLARPGRVPATKSLPVGHCHEDVHSETARSFRLSCGGIELGENSCAIDVSGPGCSVHLTYEGLRGFEGKPVVIRTGGRSKIVWRPLQMRYRVSGSVVIDGEAVEVPGFDGYVDYLESSYLPPVLPVRTLHWGRLHHDGLDLVYMRAGDGTGRTAWSRLSAHAGDSVTECHELAITSGPAQGGPESLSSGGYEAEAACGSGRVHMKVRHAAAVQESSFIDHQNLKSGAVRYVLKKLTRDPRSTKWLSTADVVLERGGIGRVFTNVPLIDEFALL
jgi:hypothetical protein